MKIEAPPSLPMWCLCRNSRISFLKAESRRLTAVALETQEAAERHPKLKRGSGAQGWRDWGHSRFWVHFPACSWFQKETRLFGAEPEMSIQEAGKVANQTIDCRNTTKKISKTKFRFFSIMEKWVRSEEGNRAWFSFFQWPAPAPG